MFAFESCAKTRAAIFYDIKRSLTSYIGTTPTSLLVTIIA